MKLNPDCVRDVLLTLESCEFQESISMETLCSRIPTRNPDDVHYACIKLSEAGFISVQSAEYLYGGVRVGIIEDITYAGHEYLANIRKDTVWNGVKSIAGKVGATSLSALTQIAANVVTELIKAQFGLYTVTSS